MRTILASVVALALALSGVAAEGSLATPAASKPPAKCVKWGKKHGKRVCLKRAKPKVKPKPKPTTTTGSGTGTTPDIAPAGRYRAVTSQGTTIEFALSKDILSGFAINELDSTCNPGSWISGLKLDFGRSPALDLHGTFAFEYPVQFTGGGAALLRLHGSIDKAGRMTGSFTWTERFNADGIDYSCAAGTVTFAGGTGGYAATPPPVPALGHYHGMTAQNNHIAFDLALVDGYLYAQNLTIDEVDVSCDPAGPTSIHDYSFAPYGFFVTASGRMRYAFHADDVTFTLEMTVGAGTAAGTIEDSRILQGTDNNSYLCRSGRVAYTASLG